MHGADDTELNKALNALLFDEHGEMRPDAGEQLDFVEAACRHYGFGPGASGTA